jgi:hypothetical protein
MDRPSRYATVTIAAAIILAPATQLICAVAAASSPMRPANGAFAGKLHYTSGNGSKETGSIKVTVAKHRKVARLVINGAIQGSARSTGLSCGAANLYDSKHRPVHVKIRHASIAQSGKISTTFAESSLKVVLKGHFTATHRLTGTVRETSSDPVGGYCDSGTLHFTAKR